MGQIERRIIEAAARLLADGNKVVTEDQLLEAILPPNEPEARFRHSYAYAVDRLVRRGLLASQWEGTKRIGYIITQKARDELARQDSRSTRS
jgi:hypothetical protein